MREIVYTLCWLSVFGCFIFGLYTEDKLKAIFSILQAIFFLLLTMNLN